jgi:hypothetical protein
MYINVHQVRQLERYSERYLVELEMLHGLITMINTYLHVYITDDFW